MVGLSGNSAVCKSWICSGGEAGSAAAPLLSDAASILPRAVPGLELVEIHTWTSPFCLVTILLYLLDYQGHPLA